MIMTVRFFFELPSFLCNKAKAETQGNEVESSPVATGVGSPAVDPLKAIAQEDNLTTLVRNLNDSRIDDRRKRARRNMRKGKLRRMTEWETQCDEWSMESSLDSTKMSPTFEQETSSLSLSSSMYTTEPKQPAPTHIVVVSLPDDQGSIAHTIPDDETTDIDDMGYPLGQEVDMQRYYDRLVQARHEKKSRN